MEKGRIVKLKRKLLRALNGSDESENESNKNEKSTKTEPWVFISFRPLVEHEFYDLKHVSAVLTETLSINA